MVAVGTHNRCFYIIINFRWSSWLQSLYELLLLVTSHNILQSLSIRWMICSNTCYCVWLLKKVFSSVLWIYHGWPNRFAISLLWFKSGCFQFWHILCCQSPAEQWFQCKTSICCIEYHNICQLLSFYPLYFRADSKIAPRQWEMSLQSYAASHGLGTNLELALCSIYILFNAYYDYFIKIQQ